MTFLVLTRNDYSDTGRWPGTDSDARLPELRISNCDVFLLLISQTSRVRCAAMAFALAEEIFLFLGIPVFFDGFLDELGRRASNVTLGFGMNQRGCQGCNPSRFQIAPVFSVLV